MNIQEQVDHLIDTRPGRQLLTPVYDDPAHPIVDGLIYRSGGTTAAYMLVTDNGRIIVNTGMGYEAPHHKRVFDGIHPGPTHLIVTTQAHVDHVGGVDLFKEPGTRYVAQANNPACQRDDKRIQGLRMRTAGIWFDVLGTVAKRIYAENPGVSMAQSEPTPDILFDDRLSMTVDGLRIELIAAVGETVDCCVVWLPEHEIALVSNLFGPLFPHFPNVNTIRGDRYRFVEPQLETNRLVRALRPKMLVTGRHEPIVGADLIDASLERLHDAVTYVHDTTLDGFNNGVDVDTLMRKIALPPELRVGQGYGKVSWAVRTFWEEYVGWFRLQSTTELYPDSTAAALAELLEAAGTDAGLERAEAALGRGDAVLAIKLGEAVAAAGLADDPRLRALMADAHAHLYNNGGEQSFWEEGWLRTERDPLGADPRGSPLVTTSRPSRLRVEHNPRTLGIGVSRPRLSWWLPAGSRRQSRYRIRADIDGVKDQAEVHSTESILQPWPFDDLGSRSVVVWAVQTFVDGEWSGWSNHSTFEVGLLDPADWLGGFIGLPGDGRSFGARGARGAIHLRRQFEVPPSILRARLRATALGLYELHIDGVRVGDLELTPGFSAYRSSLEAQTYEVTDLLGPGRHELVATLTDGWFRGSVGFTREEFSFGERVGLLAQLELVDAEGTTSIIATGSDWEATDESPLIAADLMEGERIDLRRAFPPIGGWRPVASVEPPPEASVVASPSPPTRRIAELPPTSVVRLDDTRQVVSLPFNINGWLKLAPSALGPEGTEIVLTHGELLGDDGDVDMRALEVLDFMTQRPLGHGQVDVVVSAGPDGPGFEPRQTTHGFQHVRVEGAPDIDIDAVRGVLVHTDLERTGHFRCSNKRLERLHDAAVLSFVDNACEIPTDCPQRERAGWTGDWQIFFPTAAFLFDVAGFTDRWLRDLAADQWPDGRVTNHVPDPTGPRGRQHPVADHMTGSSGWGDAATLVPLEMWRSYGDTQVLARQYPSMVAWVENGLRAASTRRHPSREERRPHAAPHETYLWDTGFHWGEWCEPGADETGVFNGTLEQGHVATAYLSRSLDVLAKTSEILGLPDDEMRWSDLARRTRAAWCAEYLGPDGIIRPRTQATLCRALAFDLIPDGSRALVLDDLVALIEEADFHIGTGFLTTPFLLPTLADGGRSDVAFRLLLQDTFPSWLGMIDAGATTIWETWERPSAEHPASANHFSKGAVVSFLHQYVGGIRMDDGHPAYRHFAISPVIGGGLDWAECSLDSPYGRIRSHWRVDDHLMNLEVEVPAGTTAHVSLPDGTSREIGPGEHNFTSEVPGVL